MCIVHGSDFILMLHDFFVLNVHDFGVSFRIEYLIVCVNLILVILFCNYSQSCRFNLMFHHLLEFINMLDHY